MKLWLSAIMLSVTTPLFATDRYSEVQAAELKTRLSYYAKLLSFEAEFQQVKYIKSMNVQLKSKGSIKVQKPNEVTWKIIDPSPITVHITDKNLEMTTGKGKDAKTEKVDLAQVPSALKNLTHMTTWLKLDPVELSANYRVFKKSEEDFVFKPRDLELSMFESLEMTLDPKGHLKTLILSEKSQDSLEIRFSKPKILKEQR